MTNSPIGQNLSQTLAAIASAAQAAGRNPEEVKLVAVSKTHPIEYVRAAMAAGQVDFGENRVQELTQKQALAPEARWHLIGTLQRNKVKYLAASVYMIHSLDSIALAQEIQKQAEKAGRAIAVLLQLNISEEQAKSGLDETGAAALLDQKELFPNLLFRGLMGMAEFTEDRHRIRSQFQRLARARKALAEAYFPDGSFDQLSMGMSGDYDLAIEEGATLVRIGSAIFGNR